MTWTKEELHDNLNMWLAQGKISFDDFKSATASDAVISDTVKSLIQKNQPTPEKQALEKAFARHDEVHKAVTLDTRLSSPESGAVRRYTGTEYVDINKTAAGVKDISMPHLRDYYAETIKNIDEAIAKSTVKKPTIVYRGVNGDFAGKMRGLKAGDTITLPAYTSVSSEPYIASNFSGSDGIVMQIQVPKGANALSLYGNKLSGHMSEKEVLLPRGSHFQVVENGEEGLVLKLVRKKEK